MNKELIKRSITSIVLILILISMFFSSTIMISMIIVISFITFYEFNRLIFKILKSKILKYIVRGSILLYLLVFVFIIFFIEVTQCSYPLYKLYVFYSALHIMCSAVLSYRSI